MLRIRNLQLKFIDEASWRDFRQRLSKFLRVELPEHTADLDDEHLDQWIDGVALHAKKHGIESERAVTQYACLALDTTADFADEPDIAAFLAAPGATPEDRLEDLVDCLSTDPTDGED